MCACIDTKKPINTKINHANITFTRGWCAHALKGEHQTSFEWFYLNNQPTIHIDGKLKAKGLCDTGCDYKLFHGKAISHDILMINLIKLQVYVWQRLYGKLHKNLLFVVRVMDENDTRTGLDTYSCWLQTSTLHDCRFHFELVDGVIDQQTPWTGELLSLRWWQ